MLCVTYTLEGTIIINFHLSLVARSIIEYSKQLHDKLHHKYVKTISPIFNEKMSQKENNEKKCL